MSILVYTESENGKFKKSAFELASYGRAIADNLGVELIAVSFNQQDPKPLEAYGIDRLIQIDDPSVEDFTVLQYAANITKIVQEKSSKLILLSSSANQKVSIQPPWSIF